MTVRKQPFTVRQWLKEYGTLAALLGIALGLGVPGLYRLGAMSAQVRHLDTAIREDIKPELRALRDGVTQVREGLVELRTEMRAETKQLRADMDAVRAETRQLRADMDAVRGDVKQILSELRRGQPPRTEE